MLAVTGQQVDVATPDGVMDAYAARPDDARSYPLVVVFMDIWGLREELFEITRRIAREGYFCMVPNLFYREGRFSFAPRNAEGRTLSFDLLPEDTQREMRGGGAISRSFGAFRAGVSGEWVHRDDDYETHVQSGDPLAGDQVTTSFCPMPDCVCVSYLSSRCTHSPATPSRIAPRSRETAPPARTSRWVSSWRTSAGATSGPVVYVCSSSRSTGCQP